MANTPETITHINLGDGQGNHPIDAVTVGGKSLSELQQNMLVTTLENADDEHYPSAKCVYDEIGLIEARLRNI